MLEPSAGRLVVEVSGYRHDGPRWQLPRVDVPVTAGEWSRWIDLGAQELHGRLARAGRIAEWPSATVHREGSPVMGAFGWIWLARQDPVA